MRKCTCGYELKERKESCISDDNCKGCGLCEQGTITVVWCENENCHLHDADFDSE